MYVYLYIYIYIYLSLSLSADPCRQQGGARQRRDYKRWGPSPAGPIRPSGPCCFAVARAPFVRLVGWKTAQTASFLVGSESNVRQWGPLPAGPSFRALLFCCGEAPFVSLAGWKTAQTASFLVGSESNLRQWGPLPAFCCGEGAVCEPCSWKTGPCGRGPQARSVPQDPAVSAWQSRRV